MFPATSSKWRARSATPALAGGPVLALFLLASAPSAQDALESKELPWASHGIFFGGYLARYDSTVRFGSESLGTGIEVDLEDALDLDVETQTVRFGGFWRVSDNLRHTVSLDYTSTKRTASKTLDDDVTIGDTTFPAGTTVSSETELGILRAAYAYSFMLDERVDIAGRFGLYTMPMSFQFKGLSGTEKQDFTAPLPTIGLQGDVAITPKLFLHQSIDLFYLKYGRFEGSLTDISVALEYKAWEHWVFGLGLNSFRIGIRAEDDYPELDLTGEVQYTQNGLLGYLRYEW